MKNKIFVFIIGLLVGAIIASAGFLIFGGNKGRGDFDPSKFKDGDMTPPSFSRDKDEKGDKKDKLNKDLNNTETNTIPEKTAE